MKKIAKPTLTLSILLTALTSDAVTLTQLFRVGAFPSAAIMDMTVQGINPSVIQSTTIYFYTDIACTTSFSTPQTTITGGNPGIFVSTGQTLSLNAQSLSKIIQPLTPNPALVRCVKLSFTGTIPFDQPKHSHLGAGNSCPMFVETCTNSSCLTSTPTQPVTYVLDIGGPCVV